MRHCVSNSVDKLIGREHAAHSGERLKPGLRVQELAHRLPLPVDPTLLELLE